MPATDRELWVLNFFRNSELHGALLMGRLARTLTNTRLLVHVTRHAATEARHAAMLSETIEQLGGTVDKWLVEDGDQVTSGQPLLRIQPVAE